jgi:hypothetical protein
MSLWWIGDLRMQDTSYACSVHIHDVLQLMRMEARAPSFDRYYTEDLFFVRAI